MSSELGPISGNQSHKVSFTPIEEQKVGEKEGVETQELEGRVNTLPEAEKLGTMEISVSETGNGQGIPRDHAQIKDPGERALLSAGGRPTLGATEDSRKTADVALGGGMASAALESTLESGKSDAIAIGRDSKVTFVEVDGHSEISCIDPSGVVHQARIPESDQDPLQLTMHVEAKEGPLTLSVQETGKDELTVRVEEKNDEITIQVDEDKAKDVKSLKDSLAKFKDSHTKKPTQDDDDDGPLSELEALIGLMKALEEWINQYITLRYPI
jgi:hypothetical protein